MTDKQRLEILHGLRNTLDYYGEICSTSSTSCPKTQSWQISGEYLWECRHCVELFEDICNLRDYVKESHNSIVNPCPCGAEKVGKMDSGVAYARLCEEIERLGKEVNEL